MRIAVLILGLLLGAIMFFQTFLSYTLSSAVDLEGQSESSAVGLFMALLWLLACALVFPLPLVSAIVFAIAGLLGFAASGDFPDLAYWGGASLVLAALSLFGWFGKRRAARRERIREATKEAEQRAAMDRAVAAGIAAATGRATDAGTSGL